MPLILRQNTSAVLCETPTAILDLRCFDVREILASLNDRATSFFPFWLFLHAIPNELEKRFG